VKDDPIEKKEKVVKGHQKGNLELKILNLDFEIGEKKKAEPGYSELPDPAYKNLST
jgi:hypothetical protein